VLGSASGYSGAGFLNELVNWVGPSPERQFTENPMWAISTVLVAGNGLTSAAPEPSSLLVAGMGIAAGIAFGWCRRCRDQRRLRRVGSLEK
jgi:hypothetical protein